MQDDDREQLIGYADMAARLHALAAAAEDPAVAVQLIELATRYEILDADATAISEAKQTPAASIQ
jgi:hypothetical protein